MQRYRFSSFAPRAALALAAWSVGPVTTCAAAAPGAGAAPAYQIETRLDPASQTLAAEVGITLPEARGARRIEFLLAKPLQIVESEPRARSVPFSASEAFHGINGSSRPLAARGAVARYAVDLVPGQRKLRLKYRGKIDFPLDTQAEEYTRGFRETPGLLSTEGVYFAGSTLWYPFLGPELVSFELASNVPDGWHLISAGSGESRDASGRAVWRSEGVVDEIHLVGGPLTRYQQSAGSAQALVFLRKPDEPLARKYLAATAQYIEMYRKLIGPYPYGKFALVENFWETGYGMPSFTLLGPQIIRFPFILTSSYPHEILHNWWGNSVFVDYESGNWCEGLTAYMADHLLKEQAGQGMEFRRDTLKKYRDFVKEGRDFPLREFRSRHSAATEAVGYGKTLMGFHMLRRELGDDAFRKALSRFYAQNRGKRASFGDVRAALEAASGRDLRAFFESWVERTGAPDIALADVVSQNLPGDSARYRVTGRIVQRQAGEAYALQVPLHVVTAHGMRVEKVAVASKDAAFSLDLSAQPLLLEADPELDLFRLLDPRETAPSIGQIFGEPKILAVLPSGADASEQAAYRKLIESWRSASHDIEVASDAAIDRLPAGRAAWILGRNNRLATKLFATDASLGLETKASAVTARGETIPLAGHSAVIVRRHPEDVTKAVGWIAADPPTAFEGLGRKLPHYGKYSYLGFEGTEPANTVKGEWGTTDSPLRIDLRSTAERAKPLPASVRPKRAALAELPQLFSADAMSRHVSFLAAPEREGRGVGTRGLEDAAGYVAAQFRAAGLAPGGEDGSFFQVFRLPAGPDGKPVEVRNVIGVLRPAADGNSAESRDGESSSVSADVTLITAHYDHLGRGWPGVRAGEEGRIHPGADDNASGVAVLLELARIYGATGSPQRPLVFLASSAEESGLRGARHFLEHPTPYARERIRAAVNLDTVGRLGAQEISALATGSAGEWPHIFRGVGFTTGIRVKSVDGAAESSDQLAFIERGIPAVQLFTGAHLDYHRPSDTAEKIDADGMVKVATVVKETVDYLLGRAEPLTATIARTPGASVAPSAAPAPRRASLGTVPDFAFAGPGVRVESIVPGSAAASAGLAAGDVIVSIDGRATPTLQAYSDLLKTLSPGATVAVLLRRDGRERTVQATLQAR
jgi:hypothetical protein